MYSPADAELVTLDDIKLAHETLKNCPSDMYRRTPMLSNVQDLFGIKDDIELYLKLENTQVTGSFKVRGAIIELKNIPEGYGTEEHKLVSISAGNYGKAFAYLANKMGLKGKIIMPDDAPVNRATLIRGYGIEVERLPALQLMNAVEKHCKEDGMIFVHPFDDKRLIAGQGTTGLEILEDVSAPDIVLVCCGGGGLSAGLSAAIKLSGHKNCRIYAVEPQGSRTMYESFKAGHPVHMDVKSVASGLTPTFAGSNTYRHCKQYLTDVLLVSDEEILTAMMLLYRTGLLVEPSGAAAFAALYHGKVPNTKGKKIIVVITGGNVSPEELVIHAKTVESFAK